MSESLGKCCVCGDGASVVYPLLSGEPAFCSEHHNPKDAGPFGCDFSGPDDFDIPFDYDDIPFSAPKPQALDRETFVWVDINGSGHLLNSIDDNYLNNIINYLERGKGHAGGGSRREAVVAFLKEEAARRIEK